MQIKGLELPFGIKPVDSGPVDSWSGPFTTTTEALTSIPKPIRFLTMEVRITGETGGSKMYWFKDGVEDADLVIMNDTSDIVASINSEISARTAGDILLYNQLTGETEQRVFNDLLNYNLITGLTETVSYNQASLSGLTQTVADNYALLTGETENRLLEDIRLNNLITGLTQTVIDNYNLLTGETEDRTLEDIRLNNLITGETENRSLADIILNNLITGETESRILEDIRLNDLITGETESRIAADIINYNLITGETFERIAADVAINNAITGLTQTVTNNYNLLTGETEIRLLEDIRLNNLITGETADRIAGDITNFNLITGLTNTVNNNYNLFTGHTHDALYASNGGAKILYIDESGAVHIDADIYQSGSTYDTHAEKIYTKNDYIILRDGATAGLSSGEYTGIEAIKYDGLNNGRLVFDNSGTARVGDVGFEQPLTTRDESSGMTDNTLVYWDAVNQKMRTSSILAYSDFVNATGDTLTGTYDINGTVIITPTGITAPNIAYSSDLTSYLTKSEAESKYVDVTGDTITGNLTVNQKITTNDAKGYYIGNKLVVSTYSWGGDNNNVWIGGSINNSVSGSTNNEGNNLIAIGIGALAVNTTGFNNNAMGIGALAANTTGIYNNAIGTGTLASNTTGVSNNAMGDCALYSNDSGYNNTAMGDNALYSNTSGWNNIAIGPASLYNNTIGGRNTAIGDSALFNLTDGKYNIAIGDLAGAYIEGVGSNTLSDNSIYIGSDTRPKANNELNQIVIGHNAKGNGSNTTTIGNTNTIGTYLFGTLSGNTNAFFSGNVTATGFTENGTALSDKYLGISGTAASATILATPRTIWGQTFDGSADITGALSGATTITATDRNAYYIGAKLMLSDYSWGGDNNNVWVGVLNSTVTGSTNTEGNYNTAVGHQTLMSTRTGYDNTAIGAQALKANTSGYQNSVVGSKSLIVNTTGYRNCAFGQESLNKNIGGINNIAIGYRSLYNNANSGNHVAIGTNALLNNTNGFNNTAIGGSALSVCTSGYYNVAVGFEALGGISGGYRNIGIGYQAGRSVNASGLNYGAMNSIYIGHETKAGGADQTNEIAIGYQTIGRGSNTTTIGNTGTTAAYIFGNLMLGFASNPGSYKLAVSGTTYFSDNITAPNIAYSSDLTNLLTNTQAAEIYLSKTGATETYLTKTGATETYLNKSAASGDTMNGPLTLNNTLSVLTNTITGKTAGTTTIYTLATSKGNCMIIDYTVYNNGKTALRSGTVMCNFTDTAITYKEDSTADINSSTEAVTFVPAILGSDVIFQTIITGVDTWNFKLSVRYF